MSVYFFRKRGVCGGGTFCAWLFAGMLLTAVWGCSRHEPVARIERQERGMALYREAIAEEQAGNLDGAIRLLKQLLASEPQIFSAHFQLATLLQDYAKDYVGAIHHYIAYLELRPDAEKASVPLACGRTISVPARSKTAFRSASRRRWKNPSRLSSSSATKIRKRTGRPCGGVCPKRKSPRSSQMNWGSPGQTFCCYTNKKEIIL